MAEVTYLITSQAKSGNMAALLAEWEKRSVLEYLHHMQATEILRTSIPQVRAGLHDNARVAGAAVTLLLSAVAPRAHALNPSDALVYTQTVEDFLVPGADFETQFNTSEFLLTALREALTGYVAACKQQPEQTFHRCLATLKHAMTTFSPAAHHLTPAHALYLQVALASNNPVAGSELVDSVVITEINPCTTGATLSDFLRYYYFAGMVYTVCRRWKDAVRAFESAMAVPNYGSNAIMIAAFKAYVLVSLILKGHVSALVNHHLERFTRPLCREYYELEDAFRRKNLQMVHLIMTQNADVFVHDQLDRLAHEAHASLARHAIRAFALTYVSCTLADIAEEVGCSVEDAREVVLDMVDVGDISAEMASNPPFTVTFSHRPAASPASLDSVVKQCTELNDLLEATDQEVLSSFRFATSQLRNDPKFSEIMQEYEAKRKSERSTLGMIASLMHA